MDIPTFKLTSQVINSIPTGKDFKNGPKGVFKYKNSKNTLVLVNHPKFPLGAIIEEAPLTDMFKVGNTFNIAGIIPGAKLPTVVEFVGGRIITVKHSKTVSIPDHKGAPEEKRFKLKPSVVGTVLNSETFRLVITKVNSGDRTICLRFTDEIDLGL